MATLTAQFDFIKPLDLYKREKPYRLFLGKPEGAPDYNPTNVQYDRESGIPIHDIRGSEGEFTLERNGFEYIHHDQKFTAFDDHKRIVSEYLPEVERVLLKELPYAHRVFVYDWRVTRPATLYQVC